MRHLALCLAAVFSCNSPPAEAPPEASAQAAKAPASEPETAAAPPAAVEAEAAAEAGELCRIRVDTGDGWTDRGEVGCPADGTVRVAIVGDVGLPGAILDATTAGLLRACPEAGGCQLLAIPGDLVYTDGADAERVWKAVWDDALSRPGVFAVTVLGNHEYRHEPNPELKREAVFGSDGRAGMIVPAANYAVRLDGPDGTPRLALAALDTDTFVRGEPTDALEAALARACEVGAPVVAVGHHPPSSQGLHHLHEAPLEASIRKLLLGAPEGCPLVAAFAGHDHDLQAWPAGCEEAGMPAVVVSGVAGKGFRPPGPGHLTPCPANGATGAYHAGPRADGGFALFELRADGTSTVRLHDTVAAGPLTTLELAAPAAAPSPTKAKE